MLDHVGPTTEDVKRSDNQSYFCLRTSVTVLVNINKMGHLFSWVSLTHTVLGLIKQGSEDTKEFENWEDSMFLAEDAFCFSFSLKSYSLSLSISPSLMHCNTMGRPWTKQWMTWTHECVFMPLAMKNECKERRNKCVKVPHSQQDRKDVKKKEKKKRFSHSSHPLPLSSQIIRDTLLCMCPWACVCVYTTGTTLDPTLIIIRLVIDHTHRSEYWSSVCCLVEGHETLSPESGGRDRDGGKAILVKALYMLLHWLWGKSWC